MTWKPQSMRRHPAHPVDFVFSERAMLEDPVVRFVRVGDTKLAYRESGNAWGPAMVLLHGLALTSAVYWRPLIQYFGDRYRILAFDLLGHGDSDKPRCGYAGPEQARLIGRAMETLDVAPAVLIGHSLGGILATHLAIDSPSRVSRLILSDTNVPDALGRNLLSLLQNVPLSVLLQYSLLLLPGAAWLIDRLPRRSAVRRLMLGLRVVYDPQKLTPALLNETVRNSAVALAQDIRHAVLRPNTIVRLHEIVAPTLVIDGDTDLLAPLANARTMVAKIPHAQLVIVQHAGHYALLDRPEEVNSAIELFLRNAIT